MLTSLLAVALALPGCSGGGSEWTAGLNEAVLPTGVPVSTDVSLATDQQAVVMLQHQGNSVSGVLDVGAPPSALKAQDVVVGTTIPPQRYAFSGTLSGQRHFEAHGVFPGSLGRFTLVGDLPTTLRGGVMTATTDVNGDGIPEVVTSTPPSFPVLSRAGATANLQLEAGAGFNGLTTAITQAQGLFSPRNPSGGHGFEAYIAIAAGPDLPRRFLRVAVVNNAATSTGQIYDAANPGQAVVVVTYVELIPGNSNNPTIRRWLSTQGQVNIQSLSSESITLRLNNLIMGTDPTGSQAAGSFTLNGTFTAHGSSGGVYVG